MRAKQRTKRWTEAAVASVLPVENHSPRHRSTRSLFAQNAMSESKTKSFTGVAELDAAIERMGHAKDRDDHHQLLCSLSPIAARHIQKISMAFSTQGFPKFEVLWSLVGSTSLPAVDLFSRAIKDPDPYTRWAASEALAKCDSPLATDCLVAALKDRSTLVTKASLLLQ